MGRSAGDAGAGGGAALRARGALAAGAFAVVAAGAFAAFSAGAFLAGAPVAGAPVAGTPVADRGAVPVSATVTVGAGPVDPFERPSDAVVPEMKPATPSAV